MNTETPWVDLDINATEEELEEQILTSTIAAMKLTHGDKLHLYILERVLNTKEGGTANKVWTKILKRIQQEID